MLFFFRHAENFDARTGERHLKDVFKWQDLHDDDKTCMQSSY
jgi:hypothetical protein